MGPNVVSWDTAVETNAPEWFARADFLAWLAQDHVATWDHADGECADVFTVWDNGEGPDSADNGDRGIPTDIWQTITDICRLKGVRFCIVRITNLEE